jgi:hypothetical protein
LSSTVVQEQEALAKTNTNINTKSNLKSNLNANANANANAYAKCMSGGSDNLAAIVAKVAEELRPRTVIEMEKRDQRITF